MSGGGRNMIAGLYDLEETIGEGHYAVVKLARHVFTGEKVAVKVIDKLRLDAATRLQMLQEVRLMKLVQHPNVVRLYEVIDTQTKLYLVLELADGGDMYDYIMKHEGGLGEVIARKYFRQIVTAIQYCHKLHVVHRDLKPENVVFFEKLGLVKLTDFGFSNKFNPGQRLMTSCGSLAYSAPEILLGDAYDAPAVDIWSLGVILYMLVCGAAPFQEANDSETLTMIMDCNYVVPAHITKQCQGLISAMLCRDPSQRATLDQISVDPWLASEPGPRGVEQMPLVASAHLSDEDHAHIIQKMVSGDIASRDQIIECLDRNEYNHVTATYFLLAERKLRAHRQEVIKRTKGAQIRSQGKPHIPHVPPKVPPASATVESLLSPQDNPVNIQQQHPMRQRGFKFRQCSIVEEEEDVEEEKESSSGLPLRGLSHHSSTSSLAEKSATSPQLHLDLDLTLKFAAKQLDDVKDNLQDEERTAGTTTPAPFPHSSNIGTGLSRQNSLRRSGESTSCSSPGSERKSTPGSPASPTHTSPARFKHAPLSGHPSRKLVSARSSPQLANLAATMPILNQIHEESEEGGGSPGEVPAAPRFLVAGSGAPAGAAVLRRLEQRRRLHKSRTASCSSSDASDDDSENRKKRGGRAGYPAWRDGPDDSSDNQDQGGGGSGAGQGGGAPGGGGRVYRQGGGGGGGEASGGDNQGGPGGGGRHHRLHRNAGRVRQSSSLNRISELHETDFSGDGEGCVAPSDGSQRQFTPQLSSESEGEPPGVRDPPSLGPGRADPPGVASAASGQGDLLSRYLESLSVRSRGSRDDSQNSSDSECNSNTGEDGDDTRNSRRSRVNMRVLEERLNMIQEECNRLSDDETDDERSATNDDPSDVMDRDEERLDNDDTNNNNDDDDDTLSDDKSENNNKFDNVFDRFEDFLDNKQKTKRTNGRSRSEGWTLSECEADSPRFRDRIIEIYSCRQTDDTASFISERGTETSSSRAKAQNGPVKAGKSLHRAHSCGSLFASHKAAVPGFWDLLSDRSPPLIVPAVGDSVKGRELTLTLTSVSAPLSLLHLQTGTSRCCSLC